MQQLNKNAIPHTCVERSHSLEHNHIHPFKQFLIELFSARAGVYVKQKSDQA